MARRCRATRMWCGVWKTIDFFLVIGTTFIINCLLMSRIYIIEPHQRWLLLTAQTLTDTSSCWGKLREIRQTSLCAAPRWGLYSARLMMYYLVWPLSWLNNNEWCVEITATYLAAILNVNILAVYLPLKSSFMRVNLWNSHAWTDLLTLTRVTSATHAKKNRAQQTHCWVYFNWVTFASSQHEWDGRHTTS